MSDEKVSNNSNLIDLDKIIRGQKSIFIKHIPQFIINYLKKLIHQDDLNVILSNYGHLSGLPFVKDTLNHLNIKHNLIGKENLPSGGHYVFASNHPLGGLDGLIILNVIGGIYGDVKAVINELLLNIKTLRPVFTGVNIFGHNSREQLIELDKLFESDIPVVVFPAGLVSRRKKGIVKDLKWKKSFLTKAIHYKRDIVPIHFEGRNSNRFYNIASLRKFLHLKFNIEMVLLPDELFRYQEKTITLRVGKPIPYQVFDKRFSKDEWAEKLKEHVYLIGQGKDVAFPY